MKSIFIFIGLVIIYGELLIFSPLFHLLQPGVTFFFGPFAYALPVTILNILLLFIYLKYKKDNIYKNTESKLKKFGVLSFFIIILFYLSIFAPLMAASEELGLREKRIDIHKKYRVQNNISNRMPSFQNIGNIAECGNFLTTTIALDKDCQNSNVMKSVKLFYPNVCMRKNVNDVSHVRTCIADVVKQKFLDVHPECDSKSPVQCLGVKKNILSACSSILNEVDVFIDSNNGFPGVADLFIDRYYDEIVSGEASIRNRGVPSYCSQMKLIYDTNILYYDTLYTKQP